MKDGSRRRREDRKWDCDEATEPYLIELRKIFVRKLLAT